MKRESVETLVIGAGLAGLSAAVRLHEAGREVLVLEASDAVGGRVRTDEIDGFLLDRGFQVYLDAYPESGRFLDLPALDLHPFEPGALVWKGGRLRRIMDVFRRPGYLLETALQPVGTPLDKLRVARMRRRLLRKPIEAIWSGPQRATIDLLRDEGFSERFIDEFFRGFYGGIFLEDLLVTSSRMFEFTFSLFSRGSATLPEKGMQSIPRQLAARLPAAAIRFHSPVRAIDGTTVRTDDTEFAARHLVLATDGTTAAALLHGRPAPRWNGTTCLQFAAPEAPFPDRLIALKGDRDGLIHHLCVPSNVAAGYAPAGSALVSVSVIGRESASPDLESRVRRELQEWFGSRTDRWELLSLHRIERSLPVDPPGHFAPLPHPGGVILCGDHTRSASIEGALGSGLAAAEGILQAAN
jgi:phytoene dehydrogenase-like protein